MKNKYREHDVTTANNGDVVQVIKNRWFWCAEGDPKRAYFYGDYACQCNARKSIAEGLPVGRKVEGAELVFIPVCYVPWDTTDYSYV